MLSTNVFLHKYLWSPYGEPARTPFALGTSQGRIHLSCGFLSSVQNSRLRLLMGLFAQGGGTAPLPSFHRGKMWSSGLDPAKEGPLKVPSLLFGLLLLSSLSSPTPLHSQASRPPTPPQGWEAVFRAQRRGALRARRGDETWLWLWRWPRQAPPQ